jgi:hypothetical protein
MAGIFHRHKWMLVMQNLRVCTKCLEWEAQWKENNGRYVDEFDRESYKDVWRPAEQVSPHTFRDLKYPSWLIQPLPISDW